MTPLSTGTLSFIDTAPPQARIPRGLKDIYAHYLVGIAEEMKYFTTISNFFLRIAQLHQKVIHLEPADQGIFKVRVTSSWFRHDKGNFVIKSLVF